MIKNVERRFPYINLTRNQVQKCIGSLKSNAKVIDFNLSSSGLSNTNYIVNLNSNKKVVLRVHSNDHGNNGLKELNVCKLLIAIPEAPKVLYYQPANGSDFSYSIIEFMDGETLTKVSKSQDLSVLYFEIGAMLAKLQAIKFPAPGLLTDDLEILRINTKHNNYHPVTNYVLDCLDNRNLLLRMDTTLISSLKELIQKNDQLLFSTDADPHLVHGDCKIENIIAKQSADGVYHLSGILDWEHARSDSSYGDISNLFRGDYIENSKNKLAFYEGFTKNGSTLIHDWDQVSKLIDLVNLCSFLCGDEDRPELYNIMLRHIRDTIAYFAQN